MVVAASREIDESPSDAACRSTSRRLAAPRTSGKRGSCKGELSENGHTIARQEDRQVDLREDLPIGEFLRARIDTARPADLMGQTLPSRGP